MLLPNWVGKRQAVRRGHSYKGKGNAVWGQGMAESGVLSSVTLLLPDTVESGCLLATMSPFLMFLYLIWSVRFTEAVATVDRGGGRGGVGGGPAGDQAQGLEHTRQALYPCAMCQALLCWLLWEWGHLLILHCSSLQARSIMLGRFTHIAHHPQTPF